VISAIHELSNTVRARGSLDLLHQVVSSSDHVIFPARSVADRILSTFSLAHDSIQIASPGILRPNPFVDERAFARLQVTKQLDIPPESILVLGCGQASHRKGFDLFVRLACMVTPRLPEMHIHFVWVGAEDPAFCARHGAEIAAAERSGRLHRPGPRQHAGLYFAASDVFALTSREDPFPTVVLEAMEAGAPVVAFEEAGGFAEAIGSEAGVLVPYLDVEAMAGAVERLITDESLRSSIGAAGRRRVEGLDIRSYVQFLAKLLARSGVLAAYAAP
jgi:glycosyltransferase involved in cell wall biosynthesis